MGTEVWSWLGFYMLAGAFALATMRVAIFLRREKTRKMEWGPFALHMVKNSVGLVASVVLWPVSLPILGLELLAPVGRFLAAQSMEELCCKRKHLRHRVTILEADLCGVVDDPLHRVPNCPFGHLNKEWVAFVSQILPNDVLWSFRIPGEASAHAHPGAPKWALPRGAMSGYAVVRRRKVVAEFIYE